MRSRFSGTDASQLTLISRLPAIDRSLEIGQVPLGDSYCLSLVGHSNVDDAAGNLGGHRPHIGRVVGTEPAALDHGRPAHSDR